MSLKSVCVFFFNAGCCLSVLKRPKRVDIFKKIRVCEHILKIFISFSQEYVLKTASVVGFWREQFFFWFGFYSESRVTKFCTLFTSHCLTLRMSVFMWKKTKTNKQPWFRLSRFINARQVIRIIFRTIMFWDKITQKNLLATIFWRRVSCPGTKTYVH